VTDRQSLTMTALQCLEEIKALRFHCWRVDGAHRDVTIGQLHVLITLSEQGAMTMGQLAQRLGMSLSAASSFIDRLEDKGYVARLRDDQDRRIVMVDVSERGRELASELVGSQREQMGRLLDTMGTAELTTFLKGLEALRATVMRLVEDGAA
jgi:DNA-binding MarR family transcriptional regulator